jgi:hypothetical protein
MNAATSAGPAEAERAPKPRYGKLAFYHANAKATGTAVQFELRVNRRGEKGYDCIFLEMAQQATRPVTGEQRRAATFDWHNKVTVKLDFCDVCEFLTVLEGHREYIGNGRSGIYHESAGSNTLITFQKAKERDGYYLGVSRKDRAGDRHFKAHIVLSPTEGTGLRCVFQAALFFMTFHASIGR